MWRFTKSREGATRASARIFARRSGYRDGVNPAQRTKARENTIALGKPKRGAVAWSYSPVASNNSDAGWKRI